MRCNGEKDADGLRQRTAYNSTSDYASGSPGAGTRINSIQATSGETTFATVTRRAANILLRIPLRQSRAFLSRGRALHLRLDVSTSTSIMSRASLRRGEIKKIHATWRVASWRSLQVARAPRNSGLIKSETASRVVIRRVTYWPIVTAQRVNISPPSLRQVV